jgi:hypothetical protein
VRATNPLAGHWRRFPKEKCPLRQGRPKRSRNSNLKATGAAVRHLVDMAYTSELASVTSAASAFVGSFVRPACVAITTFQVILAEHVSAVESRDEAA